MPYKLKESVRHKFSKASYRLKNWSAYNASLKARGSLTIWFSEEAIAAWNTPSSSGRRGRRKRYSDIAITTSLSLKLIYRLGLWQTEGLIRSIIALMGINLRSPDYTTISRRSSLVDVKKLHPRNTADGVVIMIDSTGLKLYGEKEWCVHKHGGTSLRRSWRKLHLSIDDTGYIHSSELTTLHESDDSQVSPLLDAVTVPIVKIIADGGYNTTTVESYVQERAPENKPDIVIPPNKNTKLSSLEQPSIQDQHIIAIREQGRQRWQKETGYNRRSKVESAMYRYKTIIGRKMSARTIETQKTESKIAVFVVSAWNASGHQNSLIAQYIRKLNMISIYATKLFASIKNTQTNKNIMLKLPHLLFICVLSIPFLPAHSTIASDSPYIYPSDYYGGELFDQWPNQQHWGRGHEWWRYGEIRFIWGKDISYNKPDISKGSIDLIQSKNAGVWTEAYRLMNGLGMNSIDTPEKHAGYTDNLFFFEKDAWLKQITPFMNMKELEKDKYSVGDYPRHYNYPFALEILKERINSLGKEHPYIKEWIAAQQAVFSNRDNQQFIPGPAIAQAGDSPKVIAMRLADRNYQIASAYFYGNILDKALEYYHKIEHNNASPYQKWAAYMVARTLLCQRNYDAAYGKIHTILKDDSLNDIHYATNGLLSVIAERSDNEQYQAENLQQFISPLLMPIKTAENKAFFTKNFRSLNRDLWYALNMYPAQGAEYLRKDNDLLDWLLTFREQDLYVEGVEWFKRPLIVNSEGEKHQASNDMVEHALLKWHETGKIHWLIAVMLRIPPEHPFAQKAITLFQNITQKMEAGTITEEEQWAYPTVFHHAIRLMIATKHTNEAETLLYNALEHKKEFAPRVAFHTVRYWLATGQNDKAKKLIDTATLQEEYVNPAPFYLLRLVLSETPDELIRTGIKADYNKDRYSKPTVLGHANFIQPVANILNLMPIQTLKELSDNAEFPMQARAELALVSWARAVLLERYDVADSLLPFLLTTIPELESDLYNYKEASTSPNKHHAALILFLRNPRVKPFLNTDNYFRNEYYTEPEQNIYQYIDKYNYSNNNWWCMLDEAELLGNASSSLYNAIIHNNDKKFYDSSVEKFVETNESMSQSQPFIQSFKPLQLRNSDELKSLNAKGDATTYLPKETIAWANNKFILLKYLDRNSPLSEALHRSVIVARYGCEQDKDKGLYSHQAFRILHRQFPINIWREKTPYWYQ